MIAASWFRAERRQFCAEIVAAVPGSSCGVKDLIRI
jgi:hypothetical protein